MPRRLSAVRSSSGSCMPKRSSDVSYTAAQAGSPAAIAVSFSDGKFGVRPPDAPARLRPGREIDGAAALDFHHPSAGAAAGCRRPAGPRASGRRTAARAGSPAAAAAPGACACACDPASPSAAAQCRYTPGVRGGPSVNGATFGRPGVPPEAPGAGSGSWLEDLGIRLAVRFRDDQRLHVHRHEDPGGPAQPRIPGLGGGGAHTRPCQRRVLRGQHVAWRDVPHDSSSAGPVSRWARLRWARLRWVFGSLCRRRDRVVRPGPDLLDADLRLEQLAERRVLPARAEHLPVREPESFQRELGAAAVPADLLQDARLQCRQVHDTRGVRPERHGHGLAGLRPRAWGAQRQVIGDSGGRLRVGQLEAELESGPRLLQVHDRGHAVEEGEQHRRGEAFQTHQVQPARLVVGTVVGNLGAIGPHVHRGPAADRAGADQQAGDDVRGTFRAHLVARHPDQPLGGVELVPDLGIEGLQLRPVVGGDRAYRQRAGDERVGPVAVQVEEPDRFGRQQPVVDHEVLERHPLGQPKRRQPVAHPAGQQPGAALSGRLHHVLLGVPRDAERVA